MYQFDDIGSTYLSLPPNMQEIEEDCFGYALDKQMKKFHLLANKITIWSDLDKVDPKYYDYMALCIKAPYYRSDYDNEMKLKLLKSAIEMHRYAGTRKAIDSLLDIIFERAEYTPWFDYDGVPYHFKPKIFDILTEDAATVFADVVRRVKAARSIMDAIAIGREAFGTIYVGVLTNGSIKNATICEKHELESEIGLNLNSGAFVYQSSKGDTIRELHMFKNDITETNFIAVTATMSQKNAAIREEHILENSASVRDYTLISQSSILRGGEIQETDEYETQVNETIYTKAGIYSIQIKSTIKEE